MQQRAGDKVIIPSWVCGRSILFSAKVTEVHVSFLPFILKSITEYSTVYNFVKIAKQLDQDALPIFCDKGVFRILVDTSKVKMNFRSLFKCSMDFMQPSVFNIALRSISEDLESMEVSDRQKSSMKITGINQFAGFSDAIKSIQKAYVSKHFDLAQAYVN